MGKVGYISGVNGSAQNRRPKGSEAATMSYMEKCGSPDKNLSMLQNVPNMAVYAGIYNHDKELMDV